MRCDVKATKSVEQVALGFIRVANEAMCRPIRALTQAKVNTATATTTHNGFPTRTTVLRLPLELYISLSLCVLVVAAVCGSGCGVWGGIGAVSPSTD